VYTLNEEDEDDPLLHDRDGHPVETWRAGYPYDERMARADYELPIELLSLYVPGKFDYDEDHELAGEADPLIVGRALAD